ncbi:MAG: hypothetical protein NT038_02895 [Euryarchaeota archaeon]|nr:hypothetical protein [Euryarchaeota archaeon]
MKRCLVVGGSIGAVVLLVLVMFPSVVSVQATKTTINDMVSDIQSKNSLDERIQTVQHVIKSIAERDWTPGWFISGLLGFLLMFSTAIIWFLFTGIWIPIF